MHDPVSDRGKAGDDDQDEHGIVLLAIGEESDRVDAGDAVVAARQAIPFVDHREDELAERQRQHQEIGMLLMAGADDEHTEYQRTRHGDQGSGQHGEDHRPGKLHEQQSRIVYAPSA